MDCLNSYQFFKKWEEGYGLVWMPGHLWTPPPLLYSVNLTVYTMNTTRYTLQGTRVQYLQCTVYIVLNVFAPVSCYNWSLPAGS